MHSSEKELCAQLNAIEKSSVRPEVTLVRGVKVT